MLTFCLPSRCIPTPSSLESSTFADGVNVSVSASDAVGGSATDRSRQSSRRGQGTSAGRRLYRARELKEDLGRGYGSIPTFGEKS